jgi:hypothetical protein
MLPGSYHHIEKLIGGISEKLPQFRQYSLGKLPEFACFTHCQRDLRTAPPYIELFLSGCRGLFHLGKHVAHGLVCSGRALFAPRLEPLALFFQVSKHVWILK